MESQRIGVLAEIHRRWALKSPIRRCGSVAKALAYYKPNDAGSMSAAEGAFLIEAKNESARVLTFRRTYALIFPRGPHEFVALHVYVASRAQVYLRRINQP